MNQIFSTCGICHGIIGLNPCNCVLPNVDAVNTPNQYVDKTQNNRHDLTDEEIEKVGKETMLLQFFQSIEATADHGDSAARAMTAMIRQQAFEFARAILRKAQEQ